MLRTFCKHMNLQDFCLPRRIRTQLSSRQHSSTVSLLRVKDVESVAVPIPSSLVQQQIAALIECADDGYRAGIRAAGLRRRIAYEAIEKTLLS